MIEYRDKVKVRTRRAVPLQENNQLAEASTCCITHDVVLHCRYIKHWFGIIVTFRVAGFCRLSKSCF